MEVLCEHPVQARVRVLHYRFKLWIDGTRAVDELVPSDPPEHDPLMHVHGGCAI